MRFTTKKIKPVSFVLWGITCLSFLQNPSSAQELSLQEHINASATALENLDSAAQSCQSSLDSATAIEAKKFCNDFLASLDGEVLANYLSNCSELKSWRDDYIAASQSNSANSSDDNDTTSEEDATNLQLLISIEFNCGENALQKRTQYVVDTFTLLQDGQIRNQRADSAMRRRLTELEFNSVLNQERSALRNSVQQQQSIRSQETQRQFDNLQNELIRQQIRYQQ
ncbi:MAG TPA: hypothetical protein EYG31_04560 [Porticoccaceae bacterium]|nr:hypothetical protein [Gammaproteobacteria bacterium]HIL59893.1 hypothetical protein [Porticoccaceae bacterium]